MKEIDDLDGSREVEIGLIPDPFSSVSRHDGLVRPCLPPLPSFGIETATEWLTALDGAYIAGRGLIPYRIALFIDGGLREYAAQLGLTGVGGLAVLFASTAFSFLFHYGNTRAIHLHIQNGNAWPQRDGQLQLECSLQLAL